MHQFTRSRLALIIAAFLFAGYFAVGALAAPDVTPWPDALESHDEDAPDEGTEVELPDDADETEDADEADDVEEPQDDAEVPQDEGDIEQEQEDVQGVSTDSPACAGTEADPNPHDTDTDRDFEGCREVETDEGMKNLPDPAADAEEDNPGIIGEGHDGDDDDVGPPADVPPGPPEGDPPHGHAHGHATPTPTP
jgi:hypothetical protein